MNELAPWTIERHPKYLGVHTVDSFRLRTYSISAGPGRDSGPDLMRLPSAVARMQQSEEFTTHNVGFLILNLGRRGTTALLYHFGVWVDMPEVFLSSWYRYSGSDEFELLDSAEPVMCFVDAPYILTEIRFWRGSLLKNMHEGGQIGFGDAYLHYLARGPVTFG